MSVRRHAHTPASRSHVGHANMIAICGTCLYSHLMFNIWGGTLGWSSPSLKKWVCDESRV